MANPLFNLLGGNMPMGNTPFGNMQQMIMQFQQFKNSFNGDPKQAVMQMVNSGRISQDQLNQLQQAAQQFQNMLK